MRLIDADALTEKKYTDKECSGCGEASAFRCGWNDAIDTICENAPTIEPKTKVIAQITCDENKMREIVHKAVEHIEDTLSIDIVFCPNCQFCREHGGHANCNGYLYCTKKKSFVNEDDYCSWGKEK